MILKINYIKKRMEVMCTLETYFVYCSYCKDSTQNNKAVWGIGLDEDIIESSIEALCAAINRLDVWEQ